MVEFKKETPKEIKYISTCFNSGKFTPLSRSYFDVVGKKLKNTLVRVASW